MAKDLFRPVDDTARGLAHEIMENALFGSLAVLRDGHPMVTRVAIARDEDGVPLTLISDLSTHTQALRTDPRCSLLLGEPKAKGDPLAHPRLTLQAKAEFVEKTSALVARYLAIQPKAKLYISFTDFHFARLVPFEGLLNGGFGKAYQLTSHDLAK